MVCPCCTPPYCCPSEQLPSFLEFTVSGFTSSRGTFTDFNPNRTYLLPTPIVGTGITGDGSPVTQARTCLRYGGFEVSFDESLWNIANVQQCTQRKVLSSSPVFTWLWQVRVGRSEDGFGCVDAGGLLCVEVLLQSRTDNFPNEIAVIDTNSLEGTITTGLTRQQFIDAVCARSLNLSGSASGGHQTPTAIPSFPFTACLDTLGSYSFDWTLAVSGLP